jgi:hypothetical protein
MMTVATKITHFSFVHSPGSKSWNIQGKSHVDVGTVHLLLALGTSACYVG